MSRIIEDAIDALRGLPEDLQERAARAIINFVNQNVVLGFDDRAEADYR